MEKDQSVIINQTMTDGCNNEHQFSIPVVVVPILAPNVRGYIRSKDITPIPARGVRADVKIELL